MATEHDMEIAVGISISSARRALAASSAHVASAVA